MEPWVPYFGAEVAGRRHLWRQRFPDGQPVQITTGTTEEDGMAMAPDGRSLITSISTQQSAVWIHDSHGDHAVSTEGYAAYRDDGWPPSFSSDGKHLYYLLRRDSPESAHLANKGELTWSELAHEVARRFRLDRNLITTVTHADMNYRATRPLYSVLSSEKGTLLPSLESALDAYFELGKIEKRRVA